MRLYGLPPAPPPGQTARMPGPASPGPTQGDIKAQGVRLLDVGLFGPLTILGALNKEPPWWMRLALLAYGVGTIVYNWQNFVQIQAQQQPPGTPPPT